MKRFFINASLKKKRGGVRGSRSTLVLEERGKKMDFSDPKESNVAVFAGKLSLGKVQVCDEEERKRGEKKKGIILDLTQKRGLSHSRRMGKKGH